MGELPQWSWARICGTHQGQLDHCTMWILHSIFCLQPYELRRTIRFAYCFFIYHIFIIVRSVLSKILMQKNCKLQSLILWSSLKYPPVSKTGFWLFMFRSLCKYKGIWLFLLQRIPGFFSDTGGSCCTMCALCIGCMVGSIFGMLKSIGISCSGSSWLMVGPGTLGAQSGVRRAQEQKKRLKLGLCPNQYNHSPVGSPHPFPPLDRYFPRKFSLFKKHQWQYMVYTCIKSDSKSSWTLILYLV